MDKLFAGKSKNLFPLKGYKSQWEPQSARRSILGRIEMRDLIGNICDDVFYKREMLVRESRQKRARLSTDRRSETIRKSEQKIKNSGAVFRTSMTEAEKCETFTKMLFYPTIDVLTSQTTEDIPSETSFETGVNFS